MTCVWITMYLCKEEKQTSFRRKSHGDWYAYQGKNKLVWCLRTLFLFFKSSMIIIFVKRLIRFNFAWMETVLVKFLGYTSCTYTYFSAVYADWYAKFLYKPLYIKFIIFVSYKVLFLRNVPNSFSQTRLSEDIVLDVFEHKPSTRVNKFSSHSPIISNISTLFSAR